MTQSLITKYRPTKFSEVIGQDAVARSFAKAIKDKSSHAFLLSGPTGTGKTTLARIAAKEAGAHPRDIQEVDAATFTGIDDMRTLTEALKYRPLGDGTMKVLIVNECQGLSKQAWDSLLTKVEEPPEWLIWIFTTTLVDKVPAAIKSRCTKYDLKLVNREDLVFLLETVVREEGLDLEPAIIDICAKHAQGSPRAALSALGACLSARTKDEALALLKSAEEKAEAIDLARALLDGKPWPQIKEILGLLKEDNPESIRHVVRAYMTSVIMGAKGQPPIRALAVLEAFSQSFPSGDGNSPLVLAVCKMMFGDK
jgi:DNA polymerase-3 subunit gamma/tau